MAKLPEGWGALEYAEHKAREALAKWDGQPDSGALYLHRAMALAEATRNLLAELEAERRVRNA